MWQEAVAEAVEPGMLTCSGRRVDIIITGDGGKAAVRAEVDERLGNRQGRRLIIGLVALPSSRECTFMVWTADEAGKTAAGMLVSRKRTPYDIFIGLENPSG